MTYDWEKQFDENIPQTDKQLLATGESETYKFGYKRLFICENGEEIQSITDWGNIKSFLRSALQKQAEETKEQIFRSAELKQVIDEAKREIAEEIIGEIPDSTIWTPEIQKLKQILRHKYLGGEK